MLAAHICILNNITKKGFYDIICGNKGMARFTSLIIETALLRTISRITYNFDVVQRSIISNKFVCYFK